MAIQRCKNGHYYNDSESPNCPYCSGESSIGKTIPLGEDVNGQSTAFDPTELLTDTNHGDIPNTRPVGPTMPPEDGHTTILDPNKNSEIKPVRGWLVVIEGQKLGLDFRIHTGKNTIGRKSSNDICINFDDTVSGERACFVIYDEKNNAFHLMAGESTNNIYVNNEILLIPRRLVDNDIIEIGQTKLIFRSLCNDQFNY
ncbi:MAG: FHA domain-containing protein [Clostridia bacterium]|nr:FHA domain-containing protein [Clostridia bacterium]